MKNNDKILEALRRMAKVAQAAPTADEKKGRQPWVGALEMAPPVRR
jgi:hypothetical protein